MRHHYLFKRSSDENKGSDYQGWGVFIFKQILLTNSIRNLWKTVTRICLKGLMRFRFSSGLKKWVEVGNSGVFRPEMLIPMGLPKDVSVIAWGLSLERWVLNVSGSVVYSFVCPFNNDSWKLANPSHSGHSFICSYLCSFIHSSVHYYSKYCVIPMLASIHVRRVGDVTVNNVAPMKQTFLFKEAYTYA